MSSSTLPKNHPTRSENYCDTHGRLIKVKLKIVSRTCGMAAVQQQLSASPLTECPSVKLQRARGNSSVTSRDKGKSSSLSFVYLIAAAGAALQFCWKSAIDWFSIAPLPPLPHPFFFVRVCVLYCAHQSSSLHPP